MNTVASNASTNPLSVWERTGIGLILWMVVNAVIRESHTLSVRYVTTLVNVKTVAFVRGTVLTQ